jgi:NAD(P)-dependent dehydrogenase (short-subunit alcohol dehydrogenase family)
VLEIDEAKCAALAAMGDDVLVVRGDATGAVANTEVVAAAQGRWDRVDAAVTFVGAFDLYTPLADIPDDRFDAAFAEIYDLNVRSPLHTVRAALPGLRDTGGSVVLTLSSSSFYTGRGGPLYVSSKFALRGALLQLAHELAPEVRVNGVAPGGTLDTDLHGLHALGAGDRRLADRPGREDALRERTPLQIALDPADHAGAYVFLVSDRSRGMTGEVLRTDGGLGVR